VTRLGLNLFATPVTKHITRNLLHINIKNVLVAGAGFEPTTFGL